MKDRTSNDVWRLAVAEYIAREQLHNGVELGVKRGRSAEMLLRGNSKLQLVGIDYWRSVPAYRFPIFDYLVAWARTRPFRSRVRLIKGAAAEAADRFEDGTFDFVHYDVFNYRISSVSFHEAILKPWLRKIRPGGICFGRDFLHEHLLGAFENLRLQKKLRPLFPHEPELSKMQVVRVE